MITALILCQKSQNHPFVLFQILRYLSSARGGVFECDMPNSRCFRSKKRVIEQSRQCTCFFSAIFPLSSVRKPKNLQHLLFTLGWVNKCCCSLESLPEVQSTSTSFAKRFSDGSSSELILARNLTREVRNMGYKIQWRHLLFCAY